MSSSPTTLDWDAIPGMDPDRVEEIINSMNRDDLLLNINVALDRMQQNPNEEVPETVTRAKLLLSRRLRAVREAGNRTKKAEKAAAAPLNLDDIFGDLA